MLGRRDSVLTPPSSRTARWSSSLCKIIIFVLWIILIISTIFLTQSLPWFQSWLTSINTLETSSWSSCADVIQLYGRGASDDGYAAFAAISALAGLKLQNVPHARSVIIIEACEESGSPDLPYYVDFLADRIGTPSLIVCLDSGAGNYEQFWMTTSLRWDLDQIFVPRWLYKNCLRIYKFHKKSDFLW